MVATTVTISTSIWTCDPSAATALIERDTTAIAGRIEAAAKCEHEREMRSLTRVTAATGATLALSFGQGNSTGVGSEWDSGSEDNG